jgi:hypothetical protein
MSIHEALQRMIQVKEDLIEAAGFALTYQNRLKEVSDMGHAAREMIDEIRNEVSAIRASGIELSGIDKLLSATGSAVDQSALATGSATNAIHEASELHQRALNAVQAATSAIG